MAAPPIILDLATFKANANAIFARLDDDYPSEFSGCQRSQIHREPFEASSRLHMPMDIVLTLVISVVIATGCQPAMLKLSAMTDVDGVDAAKFKQSTHYPLQLQVPDLDAVSRNIATLRQLAVDVLETRTPLDDIDPFCQAVLSGIRAEAHDEHSYFHLPPQIDASQMFKFDWLAIQPSLDKNLKVTVRRSNGKRPGFEVYAQRDQESSYGHFLIEVLSPLADKNVAQVVKKLSAYKKSVRSKSPPPKHTPQHFDWRTKALVELPRPEDPIADAEDDLVTMRDLFARAIALCPAELAPALVSQWNAPVNHWHRHEYFDLAVSIVDTGSEGAPNLKYHINIPQWSSMMAQFEHTITAALAACDASAVPVQALKRDWESVSERLYVRNARAVDEAIAFQLFDRLEGGRLSRERRAQQREKAAADG